MLDYASILIDFVACVRGNTFYDLITSLSDKTMVKNWKEYEWGVVKILFEEMDDFTLRYNVNIVGKSNQSRQIDLVFKTGSINLVNKYDRKISRI